MRALLGMFLVVITNYLIRDVFCGTVPKNAEDFQKAKAACVPGYHFITHLGLVSSIRAALAVGAFLWVLTVKVCDFFFDRYIHNTDDD